RVPPQQTVAAQDRREGRIHRLHDRRSLRRRLRPRLRRAVPQSASHRRSRVTDRDGSSRRHEKHETPRNSFSKEKRFRVSSGLRVFVKSRRRYGLTASRTFAANAFASAITVARFSVRTWRSFIRIFPFTIVVLTWSTPVT